MLKTVYEKWSEIDELYKQNSKDIIVNFYMSKKTLSKVYFGIEKSFKNIYIEFSRESLCDISLPNLKGMNIVVEQNDSINPNMNFISIKNVSNSDEVFLAFTSSLCDSLLDCTNYFDTYRVVISVIKEYKEYFSNPKFSLGLSGEQGLCAELLELSKNIDKYGEKCVYNWQGPSKNKRDFTYENYSMEVKSTAKQIDSSISISNENQLDNNYPERLDNLYLSVYIMEQNELGFSVNSLANDIIEKIDDVNIKMTFLSNLLKLKIDLELYKSQYRFTIEDHKLYKIDDKFPKITKSNISSDIYDTKYRLRLANLEEFIVSEDEVYE